MKRILLSLCLILPGLASAEHLKQTKPERLSIKATSEISVLKFHEAKNAFEVQMNQYKAQGPNYVTPDDLQRAIGVEGSLRDFIKKMQRDSSAIYALKTSVLLLSEDEFATRGAKPKK